MNREPILVVDDNHLNGKLIQTVLRAQGHEVRVARHADEMAEALRSFQPRLILMDIQLPDVDGLELTRRLKADPATRGITVVALTAYAMAIDADKARQAGCDGYLSKPIDTRAFPGQVQAYLTSRN